MNLTNEQKIQIIQLIQEGNKIQAIQAFRTFTGVSLKDAKDFVDNLSKNMPTSSYKSQKFPEHNVAPKNEIHYQAKPPFTIDSIKGTDLQIITDLLNKQNKIEAVKFVKETYNLELKEANDIITELAKKTDITGSSITIQKKEKHQTMVPENHIMGRGMNIPKKKDSARKNSGCMLLLVAMLSGGGFLVYGVMQML